MAEHKVTKVHATVVAVGGQEAIVSALSAHGIGEGDAANVSALKASAVGADVSSFARVSHVKAAALVNAGVDLTWCDIVIEELFPTFVAYQSEMGPQFDGLQQKTSAGKTQRVGFYDEELARFNVGYKQGAQNMVAVRDFFIVVGGFEVGFLFKDRNDNTTAGFLSATSNDRAPIAPTDQLFGVGDAATGVHQLRVNRFAGASSRAKTIFKPVASTVRIAQAGIEVFNFILDAITGLVTWTPRTSVTGTDLSFVDTGGGNWVIRSTSTSWATFVTGESIRVSGSTSNDTVVPNGSITITGAVPAGSGDLAIVETLAAESAGATITVDVHPFPRNAVNLEWGGDYHKAVHVLEKGFMVRHEEGEEGNIQSGNLILEELRLESSLP